MACDINKISQWSGLNLWVLILILNCFELLILKHRLSTPMGLIRNHLKLQSHYFENNFFLLGTELSYIFQIVSKFLMLRLWFSRFTFNMVCRFEDHVANILFSQLSWRNEKPVSCVYFLYPLLTFVQLK